MGLDKGELGHKSTMVSLQNPQQHVMSQHDKAAAHTVRVVQQGAVRHRHK